MLPHGAAIVGGIELLVFRIEFRIEFLVIQNPHHKSEKKGELEKHKAFTCLKFCDTEFVRD